jgi:hypothetical protein
MPAWFEGRWILEQGIERGVEQGLERAVRLVLESRGPGEAGVEKAAVALRGVETGEAIRRILAAGAIEELAVSPAGDGPS